MSKNISLEPYFNWTILNLKKKYTRTDFYPNNMCTESKTENISTENYLGGNILRELV